MLAFAANSILCRLAMEQDRIDPISFTAVRLSSGAVALALLTAARRRSFGQRNGDWLAGFWLFGYAIAFSFAYVGMSAGTGALLLFGAVQITMILAGLRAGERPAPKEWLGLSLAVAGTVYLVLPGVTAPALVPALSMLGAGIAWGCYSLRGRGSADPITDTARNFVRSTPMIGVVALCCIGTLRATPFGVLAAALSGVVASALGYALWYAALPHLSAARAGVVQLSVPALAAIGGVALLGEALTLRIAIASVLVLGGVWLAIGGRRR